MKFSCTKGPLNRARIAAAVFAGGLSIATGNAFAWNYGDPVPYQIRDAYGQCLAYNGNRLNLGFEQCVASADTQKFYVSDGSGNMLRDFPSKDRNPVGDVYIVASSDFQGAHVPPEFWLAVWPSPPGLAPGVGLMGGIAPPASLFLDDYYIGRIPWDLSYMGLEGSAPTNYTTQEILYGYYDPSLGASVAYHGRTLGPGSFGCNNDIFGDPIVGTVKSCYKWQQSLWHGGWGSFASEGSNFTFDGHGSLAVRYGASGDFNYQSVQTGPTYQCNNTTFGDPIYGTEKTCQLYFPSMRGVMIQGSLGMCMARNGVLAAAISLPCDDSDAYQKFWLTPVSAF